MSQVADIRRKLAGKLETVYQSHGLNPSSQFGPVQVAAILGQCGLAVTRKALERRKERGKLPPLDRDAILELGCKEVQRGKIASDDWVAFLSDDQKIKYWEREREAEQFTQHWMAQPIEAVIGALVIEGNDKRRNILAGILLSAWRLAMERLPDAQHAERN